MVSKIRRNPVILFTVHPFLRHRAVCRPGRLRSVAMTVFSYAHFSGMMAGRRAVRSVRGEPGDEPYLQR